jgi:hypothetical protein
MRPSLVQVTSKPFFLPISVMAVSAMLRLSPWRFTTWCSKPEDLVKTRAQMERVIFCGDCAGSLESHNEGDIVTHGIGAKTAVGRHGDDGGGSRDTRGGRWSRG